MLLFFLFVTFSVEVLQAKRRQRSIYLYFYFPDCWCIVYVCFGEVKKMRDENRNYFIILKRHIFFLLLQFNSQYRTTYLYLYIHWLVSFLLCTFRIHQNKWDENKSLHEELIVSTFALVCSPNSLQRSMQDSYLNLTILFRIIFFFLSFLHCFSPTTNTKLSILIILLMFLTDVFNFSKHFFPSLLFHRQQNEKFI